MKYYYYADFDLDQLVNCCGVLEAGQFRLNEVSEEAKKRYPGSYASHKYETREDAWKAGFERILVDAGHEDESYNQPIQFWFVKYNDDDEKFQNDELRQLVIAHPDQVYLGTFRNPNTQNIIEGYMLKYNVKEIAE